MTLILDISDSALRAVGGVTGDPAGEVRLAAAAKLYEMGRLSSGAAADLAGLDRISFLKRLKDYGVAAIQGTPEELDRDVATLRSRGV